jgi:hypothetical protein
MSELDPFAAGVGAPPGDTAAPVAMDVGPILGRCTELLRTHPGLVVGTLVLSVAPGLVFQGVDGALQFYVELNPVSEEVKLLIGLARILVSICGMLIGLWLQLGVVRIFLNLVRGGTAEIGMLVGQSQHFLNALALNVLQVLIYALGMVLLFVPFLIAFAGLNFATYAMVDKELGPIEALAESWRLTDGYKMTVFLIYLVFAIVGTVVCCSTFCVGYFLVVPILSLATAVMYHSLTHLSPRTV